MKLNFVRMISVLVLVMMSGMMLAQDDDEPDDTIIGVLQTLSIDAPATSNSDLRPDALHADIPQTRTEDGAFVLGDPEATLTIVEFADFMCPHCQTYESTLDEFIETYVATGEARLEYRMLPVVSPTLSPLTAQVAECAGEAGDFWGARALIYELASERAIDENIVEVVAEEMGFESETFAACVETADQYRIDTQVAQEAGVSSTPSVLLRIGDVGPRWVVTNENEPLRGGLPFEVLEIIVNAAQEGALQAN